MNNPKSLSSIKLIKEFTRFKALLREKPEATIDDVLDVLAVFDVYEPDMFLWLEQGIDYGRPDQRESLFQAYQQLDREMTLPLNEAVTAFFNILAEDGQTETIAPEYAKTLDEQLVKAIEWAKEFSSPDLLTLQQQTRDVIKRIKTRIVGQDDAVEQLVKTYSSQQVSRLGQRPRAAALLVGPAQSGKGFLARVLASELADEDNPRPVFELDLSSLQSANQSAQIDGNEPTYSNARPGKLTSFVRENPRAVVVLKNMDMAEPNVISRLASIFTDGVLVDQFGFFKNNDLEAEQIAPPEVDFSRTLVIATTSCGQRLYDDRMFWQTYSDNRAQAISLLTSEIRAEQSSTRKAAATMLSMFADSDVIPFKRLSGADYELIFTRAAAQLVDDFTARYGIDIELEANDTQGLSRLLISRDLPHVSPQAVSTILETEMLQLLLGNDEIALQGIKRVRIALSKCSRETAQLIEQWADGADWLEQLLRRNQYLSYHWAVSVDGKQLHLTLTDALLNKHLQVQDIRGSGAIRLEIPDVSFADIAGHHAVKEQLQDVVDLLRHPEKISQYGGSVAKGMLLWGVPGTGKTMLAKALAKEAELPVISLVATEFSDVETTREVFARARRYAPSILFIDELDAVGSRDKNGHPALINTLLSEIDGFDTSLHEPVFIIAATNLPNSIDPALLRSGRIDLHIEVPNLDRDARAFFIDKILSLPVAEPVDRNALLDLSSGMTGADLMRTASKLAAHLACHEGRQLSEKHIIETLHQHRFGEVRTVQRSQQIRALIAYHEAGHAVVSSVLNPSKTITTINTLTRKNMEGFVAFNGDYDSNPQRRVTYTECLEDIAVYLAGRLSERQYAPRLEPCAGASDDLAKATQIAEYAITELGLDAELGSLSLRDLPGYYREAFTDKVVTRLHHWLQEAEALCQQTLVEHWIKVEKVANALMDQEIITGRQFYQLIED
jgi:ATP-dependent Zn protease